MASYPRFAVESGTAKIAVRLARAVGRASRLWQQRGLGTIYKVLNKAPVFGGARCVVELSPGTFFETEVFEPFWGPTVVGGRPYEPELMHLFRRVAHLRPVLVDAGANHGYWSVIATSAEIGFPMAIAIEANPTTFAILEANARSNQHRFRTLHRAVGERSGETVRLAHAEHHIIAHVSHGADGKGVEVETTSIDDVVRLADLWSNEVFVLKLDVEGFELPAMRGASALREAKSHVVCFEDFADSGPNGFEHVRALMQDGYAMYYVSTGGACEPISTIDDAFGVTVRHPKASRSRNFFAAPAGSALHKLLDTWAREQGNA